MKNVLITGGAKGLGLEMAQALHKEGFSVSIVDYDARALQETKTHCPGLFAIEADLTNEVEVGRAVTEAIGNMGSIDVLVNNAGVIHNEPLLNIVNPKQRRHQFSSWKKTLSVNLDTAFLTTSYVVEHMFEKRIKGVIVNMSSVCAKGNAGQSAYSASKAGIEALTKTWAQELGALGIRCAAIAPGFIDIQSTQLALTERALNQRKKMTALKALGRPDQISQTLLFILANEYVTGTILEVDGGIHKQ